MRKQNSHRGYLFYISHANIMLSNICVVARQNGVCYEKRSKETVCTTTGRIT